MVYILKPLSCIRGWGTLTSVFFPWNTCGVFILATLGVSAMEYAPYAILNFTVPIISIIYGYIGFAIVKLTPEEIAEAEKRKRRKKLKIRIIW